MTFLSTSVLIVNASSSSDPCLDTCPTLIQGFAHTSFPKLDLAQAHISNGVSLAKPYRRENNYTTKGFQYRQGINQKTTKQECCLSQKMPS